MHECDAIELIGFLTRSKAIWKNPELLKLVEACAKIDGPAEHKEKAAMLIEIDEFCQRNQKAETK